MVRFYACVEQCTYCDARALYPSEPLEHSCHCRSEASELLEGYWIDERGYLFGPYDCDGKE
jgi:hypothetical protein